MHKYYLKFLGLITVLLFFPAQMLAEGNSMVLVADTRKLTGMEAWWANLYNEGHIEFVLATVIIIPLTGVILGTLADLVMSRIGIDLRNRVLAEH